MNIRLLGAYALLLVMAAAPIAAHSDEVHVSDLEKAVSVVGALIFAVAIAFLLFRNTEENESVEDTPTQE